MAVMLEYWPRENYLIMVMLIKYRADIDGLRAIAVLLVVIYHAFPALIPGGFVGVDIFFVISGYLITAILKKEMQEGKYSIKEFYRRRIDRLFPSLLIVMYTAFIFGWFTLFADEFMQMGKEIAGGAGFIANIVLYSETGYFNANSVTKPFLHLWSLGIEEQFYLVFPVILFFAFRKKLNVTAVVVTLLIISFVLNVISINSNIERTFYLPQYRHWELLAGSLLAIFLHGEKSKSFKSTPSTIMCLLAVSGFVFASFTYTPSTIFPGWNAVLPVIASVLIICFAQYSSVFKKILSSKPFVFIGLISYPLYLWHWPLLSIAHIINGGTPPTWFQWVLVAASLALATLTYFFVERPLKKVKSWKNKTIPMLILMVVIGLSALYAFIQNGIESRENIKINSEVSAQMNGALWQYTNNDICKSRFAFPEASKMPWWFCMLTKNSDPDILLLGNSFANHLYPAFAGNNKLQDLNVLSIGITDVVAGMWGSKDDIIKHEFDFIDGIIKNTPSIKYVVISGIDLHPSQGYINDLSKRISTIESAGKKVVIFVPHVKLSNNIKACFARPLKKPEDSCITDLTEVTKVRNDFKPLQMQIGKYHPEVRFYDPNKVMCDDTQCKLIIDGMPVYRDEYKHFTVYASKWIGKDFADWAKTNAPSLVK